MRGRPRLVNLTVRIAAGFPVLILLVAAVAFSPWQMLVLLVLAAAIFGMYEFRIMLAAQPGIHLPLAPLLAGTIMIHAGGFLAGAAGQHGMLILTIVIWMVTSMVRSEGNYSETVRDLSMGLFGLIWIAWFLAHWSLILRLQDGPRWCVFLLLVVTGSDIAAYLAGNLLGRHFLLPHISPNKTVEGSLGGVIGGMLGGALAAYWLPWFHLSVQPIQLMVLSALLALLAQTGDYVESLIKRMSGVKDSGRFLPGHGGFLDRLDSLILAPALLYYALTLIVQ